MAKSINPFRYFDSSPQVIGLVVMMYVRYPLSLRNVEDLLFERGIDSCAHGNVHKPMRPQRPEATLSGPPSAPVRPCGKRLRTGPTSPSRRRPQRSPR
jgi:hypothetical protein